ncbi:MAG: LytTR family DNA-binding domain-containing protein [Phaeodactylibacter sp.]|uniref:LytR/AlgR family response regulator transcription factor n=1 Tax=Phaeodactylibacter sp. TaxID=1940289 RepID=UPI0032ED2531
MKIKYLIVDDEPLAHDLIKSFAKELPHLQLVHQCYNALEAIAYLKAERVDLMFLDLHMPKLKGFDFLRTLSHPPKVIVTTAHKEFALEGYELQVADYLLKPYSFARFLKAIDNAFPPQAGTSTQAPGTKADEQQKLFIKGDKQYHRLRTDEIIYIEAYGNYTKVYLPTGTLLTHVSISYYTEKLQEPEFLRIHKSFLVALDKVDRLSGNRLFLGEHEVPIGQTYRQKVMGLIG